MTHQPEKPRSQGFVPSEDPRKNVEGLLEALDKGPAAFESALDSMYPGSKRLIVIEHPDGIREWRVSSEAPEPPSV